MTHTVLVSTWANGVFVATEGHLVQEFADQSVQGMTRDGRGGTLAIVAGRSVRRRTSNGSWSVLADSDVDLACCLVVGTDIYVGTEDAQVLRVGADGRLAPLRGFESTPGREKWYAGTAVINGQTVGPPLGIRSMSATCDGSTLFANVHVGGIPRSTDGGVTWRPTIDIDNDAHQVLAHPSRANIVAAATAVGLLVSRDGGVTWRTQQDGLHALYCSAVAFAGDEILVASSAHHFAAEGALYRLPIDSTGALLPVEGGLPRWIDGIVDTTCIAIHGNAAAIVDRGGNLYGSADGARTWTYRERKLPIPSSVLLVES